MQNISKETTKNIKYKFYKSGLALKHIKFVLMDYTILNYLEATT